jgi:hypothetical protein
MKKKGKKLDISEGILARVLGPVVNHGERSTCCLLSPKLKVKATKKEYRVEQSNAMDIVVTIGKLNDVEKIRARQAVEFPVYFVE